MADPYATIDDLPIEMLQHIAQDLSDKDLGTFRLLCRTTKNAIDCDGQSFWRRRSLSEFELPVRHLDNTRIRMFYQNCKNFLYQTSKVDPKNLNQALVSNYLRFLILNAEPIDEYLKHPASKNFDFMNELEHRTKFVQDALIPDKSQSKKSMNAQTAVILVTLGSFMLDPLRFKNTWGFDTSQAMAYASPAKEPVLKNKGYTEVNVIWILHLINFFRRHLCSDDKIGLGPLYMEMPWYERPSLWRNRLSVGDIIESIGKTWRGTYAYLDRNEVNIIRNHTFTNGSPFEDKNVTLGERAFQNLKIEMVDGPIDCRKWPYYFTQILEPDKVTLPSRRSKPMHHVKDKQSRNPFKKVRFEGTGFDDEIFYVIGYINPLPPQQNIPGWSRVTMMKYFHDESGQMDPHGLWAYEGIICPGGQMMVGRWWSPEDTDPSLLYTGPFIFWCTDIGFTLEERAVDNEAGLVPGKLTQARKMK